MRSQAVPSRSRWRGRASAALLPLLLVISGVALAPAAAAHVTVEPSDRAPNSYSVLTFVVPVESDTARTTALTVNLPTDTPFAHVQVAPVPGWTATLTRTKLPAPVTGAHGLKLSEAVTRIDWTADGGKSAGLKPQEFGRFAVSVGPLPAGGTLYFPAVQKYSDGTTANWVQQANGSAEAESPTPSFTVAAPEPVSRAAGEQDKTAVTLAAGAVAIALVALVFSVAGGLRRRR